MAISDQLTTLNGIKSDIKAAIIAKGGTATDDFTTYATAISNLPSGGGGDEVLRDLIEGDISGSFEIPDGTTIIKYGTFYSCSNLTSVTIPSSVRTIESYAFRNCSGLTGTLVIPDLVTTIGEEAFRDCTGLTSVTIGNSVSTIYNYAFRNCTGLTSVTIGRSATSLNNYTFINCTSLMSITSLATAPPSVNNSFNGVPADCAIYVPAASVETYKAASGWSARAAYIQAIPSE